MEGGFSLFYFLTENMVLYELHLKTITRRQFLFRKDEKALTMNRVALLLLTPKGIF